MGGGGGDKPKDTSTRNPGGIVGSTTPNSFDASGFGKQLGAGMANAFNQGNQVYQKPLYAGIGSQTKAGLDAVYAQARGARGMFDPAIGYAKGMVKSGGLTPEMEAALRGTQAAGGQYGKIAASGGLTGGMRGAISGTGEVASDYDQLFNGQGAPSLTERNMLDTANGKYLSGANPFFEENLRRASDDTYADVMASLGGSGRTGSSVHMDELTGALGDLNSSARMQQYETERDRQAQALQSVEAMRQQQFGNQTTALAGRAGVLGQQFGMENTGLGNQMSALSGQIGANGQVFSGEQQGIANAMSAGAALPGLYEASLQPGKTMLEVGQMRDTDAQARLMADYDLFQRRDPYSHVAKYMALLNGSQGTQGIAAPKEETPWWQTALGGAAAIAGAIL